MSTAAPRRCVVFDIDDTLYLERDYVRSGFNVVGEHVEGRFGIAGVGQRAWELFVEGNRNNTFDLIVAEFELPATIVPELVATYRNHAPTIEPCDDASLALTRLAPEVSLGVITDGPAESQRAKATALGVHRWSQATVFTAELGPGRSKPAPEPYLEIVGRLPPADTYAYVADNPVKDFVSPRRLGWRTVRIRRPGGLHQAVASGDDVDVEVEDLHDLEQMLWPNR